MAESRYTWEQGVRKDYVQRKRDIIVQRNERTLDISAEWKAGFAKLKEENDRAQKERDEVFRKSMADLEVWFKETIRRGPPGY